MGDELCCHRRSIAGLRLTPQRNLTAPVSERILSSDDSGPGAADRHKKTTMAPGGPSPTRSKRAGRAYSPSPHGSGFSRHTTPNRRIQIACIIIALFPWSCYVSGIQFVTDSHGFIYIEEHRKCRLLDAYRLSITAQELSTRDLCCILPLDAADYTAYSYKDGE